MSNTKTFSPYERCYVILDYKNNFFWVKNINYGYNYQNQSVFESRFTDNMQEATALPFEEIAKVLGRFRESPFIMGGRFKADPDCLEIRNQIQYISKEDFEYLKGDPAPLVITVPVKIEK